MSICLLSGTIRCSLLLFLPLSPTPQRLSHQFTGKPDSPLVSDGSILLPRCSACPLAPWIWPNYPNHTLEFGLDIRHFAVLVGPIPGASLEPLHLLRDSFNLSVPCDLAPTCLIFKTTSVMKKAADVEERSWVPFFIY